MKLQTPSDLARLLRNARVHGGLTQQEVADAVGISRQSLARIERGNGGASFDTVLLILDHLGIRLEATPVSRTQTTPTAAAAPNAALAAAAALAQRDIQAIPPRLLEAINQSLPKFDTANLVRQLEAAIDPDAHEAAIAATEQIVRRLTIPGSVVRDVPPAEDPKAEPAHDAAPDAAEAAE